MLQIYDDQHKRIGIVETATDVIVESTLEFADKKLTFKYPITGTHCSNLKNECYIRTKTDEYVLKSISIGKEINEYSAQLNIEEIESKQFLKGFEKIEETVNETLKEIVADTGWIIAGKSIAKKRTIRKESKCNAWDLIKDCISTFRIEIEIDTLNKKIVVYEKRGSDKGSYFIEGLNLKTISKKITTYDFFNVLIPYGKDGIGIDVLGKNYIENFQYTKKRIVRTWKDERYTNTTSLLEDAKAKLEEASKPIEAFTAEVINLAKQNSMYNIIDFELGDSIELISNSKKIKTKQRIVKMKEHLQDGSKNTIELSNVKKSFAELQKQESEVTKQEAIEVSNGKTEESLKDYSTKKETETKIAANANSILLEVKETYTSKEQLEQNYYNKTETTSKISALVGEVILSVDETLNNYTTRSEMNAAISVKADEINLEVKKKVNSEELGTKISQNAENVRIAWNNNSNYVQFESGKLVIYNGSLTTNQKRSAFDEKGSHFYRDGVYIGKIGTNTIKSDSSKKGLTFDLTWNSAFMSWATEDYPFADSFSAKWMYTRSTFDNLPADRLYAFCNLDLRNNKLMNVQFEEGGITGRISFQQIITIEKVNNIAYIREWSDAYMEFKNGLLVAGRWY